MSVSIVKLFNDHLTDFVDDVCLLFPEDVELLSAKNSLLAIKKVNPKIVVKMWQTHIGERYKEHIAAGNFEFFIEKDYVDDVSDSCYSDKIINAINRLREPIRLMNADNREKTMLYIQNLTNIAAMYAANNSS
jgi:hypothetical protein